MMKTLYVGGKHFFNRFSNLEAAIERAQDDDTIELFKDVCDAELYISKNITINGHGHTIKPKSNKAALDCASFITLHDIKFECRPRTNAVILRHGGHLENIKTRIVGPARAIYPTIVHRGYDLTLMNSDIMYIETYNGHEHKTSTSIHDCNILNYYGGMVYLNDNDSSLSKFRGKTRIYNSFITCALFENDCRLMDTVLQNFNKAKGKIYLNSCELKAFRGEMINYDNEPEDGPLKDLNPDVIPYALCIAGGNVTAMDYSSDIDEDCLGFYMTKGTLNIRSTHNCNVNTKHLITQGSIIFNNTIDESFYEIENARCSVVNSNINVSCKTKSAMQQLNEMIGLTSVKHQLSTIMNTIRVNTKYPEKDFGFSHHMIFAGDPGTGKTTVAKLVAQALFEIGAIPENKYMEVPASQMVKGFVGQTGEHVESIMKKALGGVLFIDEAYELMVKDNENTFNNDALSVMLRYMEDHRDELVIIAAGYEKEMKEFLASNVGLTRRFQWISFENYTPEEMTKIFISMVKQCKENFNFSENDGHITYYFNTLTQFYLSHPDAKGRITNGGNGGLVRNVFQQTIFARNNRITKQPESTMKITEEDILDGFNEELKKAMNVQFGVKAVFMPCNIE